MSRWMALGLMLGAGVLFGCSKGDPNRFRISGEVTFDGKPIPYGDVLFTPDGTKNNSGPQGIADIRDGKYDTGAKGGKGFAGGPTVIRVTGFSGPGGKLLCEVDMQVDLPKGNSTHNINVPKTAAAKPPGKDI